MEKKSTNTYSGISKTALRTLNRNFLAEPIKDENRISELISEFVTGELNTIYSIINSNEILNFKDQTNQTLIHAILRNESPNITEENKLEIIKTLVSKKNVSIHTMTNYNQNPLHLACQKGYVSIINYMIGDTDNIKCDQTLIDNYGNAPVHYLIDKFIRDCEENDFYSSNNQQVKTTNSLDLKKINDILKNESILLIYELLSEKKIDSDNFYYKDIGQDGHKIITVLKKFIKNKIQNSLPEIYELIDKKVNEINKIFIEFSDSEKIKLEKAKKVIFTINNDIFQIYGLDLDFKNIVWNDYLYQQNAKIKNKKEEIKNKIISNILHVNKLIQLDILNNIKNEFIENMYIHLSKFSSSVLFLYIFLNEIKNSQIVLFINDVEGNIAQITTNTNEPFDFTNYSTNDYFNSEYDKIKNILIYLFQKEFKIFLNGMNNINNLDTIGLYDSLFMADENYAYRLTYDDENNYQSNYITFINKVNTDASGNEYYLLYVPNKIKFSEKKNYYAELEKKLKELKDDLEYDEYDKFDENLQNILIPRLDGLEPSNFRYSPIRILVNLIDSICNTVINMKLDDFKFKDDVIFSDLIHKFCLFDIKYLTECIFKIINNLIILEKYLDDINEKEIENINDEFKKCFNELTTSSELSHDLKKIMEEFKFIISQSFISEKIILKFKSKEYTKIFDTIYDECTNVIDKFKELIKDFNEYNSYVQLEKYNELLSNIINSPNTTHSVKILNTTFSNYSFNLKYPLKYKDYKEKYFKIKTDINMYDLGIKTNAELEVMGVKDIEKLPLDKFILNPNYKKDFIENVWKYSNTCDFNIFYLNMKLIKSPFPYEYDMNYYNIVIVRDSSGYFYIFKTNNYVYELNNYLFNTNDFKFSRGYDVLKYDNLKKINNLKDKDGNKISGREEIKTLCNMKFISSYSDYNSVSNSINENSDGILTWMIKESLIIKEIDDMNTYVITNNLGELINMLVYMIYEKIYPYPQKPPPPGA